MCKASSQQKQAYANEAKVSSMLSSIASNFAGIDTNMLNSISANLTPIQEAGPSQFGLSPTAEAAERTSAAETLNAAGAQTANAVRGSLAAEGGGPTGGGPTLPSGSQEAIIGNLAQQNAVQQAEAQSNITQQGFNIGRQNWLAATQGLEAAPAAFENPVTGAGSAAESAASTQMQGANAITAANEAWMQPAGAIIGGIGGGLIGKIPSSNSNNNNNS